MAASTASGCERLRVAASCQKGMKYQNLEKIGLEEKLILFKFGGWIGKIYGVFASRYSGICVKHDVNHVFHCPCVSICLFYANGSSI